MQVMLFVGLMLLLLILGSISILMGIINLILRHLRKKRGRPTKKRYAVLASVFLTFGLVISCIPLLSRDSTPDGAGNDGTDTKLLLPLL